MSQNNRAQNQNIRVTGNRPIPYDIDAETTVLSACLLNSEAAEELVLMLTPDNFYRPANKVIFENIVSMVNNRKYIDPVTLTDSLKTRGELELVGGRNYVLEFADNTFALTNWKSHADIVKRMSVMRDLVYVGEEIKAIGFDAPDDVNQTVEQAERALFNVTERRINTSFDRVDSLLTTVYDEITALHEQKNHITGVATGYKDIDNLFYGLRGGDLIILAARPGVGKTAFSLNLAVNAAKLGTTVCFFSLEMGKTQLVQRILCSEARINLSKIRGGYLADGDWAEIAEASNRLSELELYIDDTPGLSLMQARAKARRKLHEVSAKRGEESKGLIIVDYLQLMTPPTARRDGNRAVEVGEISRGLKILAKELNVPIIALSQLSRAVEMRGKKRPMLSDLRESGSIEQDADIVMFIDRSMDESEAEMDGRPPLGTAELIVAKHRNGPTRDITLAYSPEYTKYKDYIDDSRATGYQ